MPRCSRRLLAVLLPALLLALPAAAGDKGWLPDFSLSLAWMEYQGPLTPTIMVLPDGSGDPFAQAWLPDGSRISCRVTTKLVDSNNTPIPGYPAGDIRLVATDGGLALCPDRGHPEGPTDTSGSTFWEASLQAGGHSRAGLQVQVNHTPLQGSDLPLDINSPDINGDMRVDLQDIVLFAADYYGAYDFRSDFHRDGRLDLRDFSRLVSALGANCP